VIGLPDGITACLFDLDGVLTSTATLHREAWKETFDALLRERAGPGFAEFTEQDYLAHVDGRPRYDGVREFLASRNIMLPEGEPDDPPDARTVHGVGNRKNALLLDLIDRGGVSATCRPRPTRVSRSQWSRPRPTLQRCSKPPGLPPSCRPASTG
jgi:beta-phosphoglucomutase-like phosphatase (HAD superfamily)